MFDRLEIGRRIVEARKSRGLQSPGALAKRLQEQIERRGIPKNGSDPLASPRPLLARQTVANWEAGKILPPWPMVELMAEVFGPDHGEAWIMFGERRAAQLKDEGYVLERVSPLELRLLQSFREANENGQHAILGSANAITNANPAPSVVPHPMRRREDFPG